MPFTDDDPKIPLPKPPFTDDDLKRLKEVNKMFDRDFLDFMLVSGKLPALLARLEAAEKALEVSLATSKGNSLEAVELWNAWRKACGK